MTEAEAKTKWCPMVRAGKSENYSSERMHQVLLRETNCIGSACMMWRWEYADGGKHPCDKSTTDGYCGLAGK